MNTPAQNIKTAFETLSPATLPALVALYADDARFIDPFNDVRGRRAVQAIFAHMLEQVGEPRFVVTRVIDGGNTLFMRWDFTFTARGKPQHIHGATHFELNDAGLITLHRDYWDAAQELYEKIPVLGSVLRWIRSQLAVKMS
jgi:ketosteroid isomerase-like protein